MATRTEATDLLTAAVKPRINLTKLAQATGIPRQRLRTLVAGGEPAAGEMAKLQEALQIPLEAWMRPGKPPADSGPPGL